MQAGKNQKDYFFPSNITEAYLKSSFICVGTCDNTFRIRWVMQNTGPF